MQLKLLVPACAKQENLHKLSILQSTIEYIRQLQGAVGEARDVAAERDLHRRRAPSESESRSARSHSDYYPYPHPRPHLLHDTYLYAARSQGLPSPAPSMRETGSDAGSVGARSPSVASACSAANGDGLGMLASARGRVSVGSLLC
ncbi:hypothetical protein BDK51DRAFT_42719 [Blyttiomyces helicus]|uniref:BHLH domain-containing protein n=1 Tax=Blyttiomyces helicus TaxID=388810 RepID=A0A4P9WG48_9FUNG|nr:hypothetical protein BDK51DRAFT_42719 [Blyttiomyces helicus]|eukprot:RKO91654.1 hypothetical protein BDK51DRAFT_42719 [Blyttiomyces helicus]